MKIAVLEAGEMGSMLRCAVRTGWPRHRAGRYGASSVQRINAEGVTVVRGDEETNTRLLATSDPTTVGLVDVAIFYVKCCHTKSAAEFARPLVGWDSVASLQNGWGNDNVLAATFPADQLVVEVAYNGGPRRRPPALSGGIDQSGDVCVGEELTMRLSNPFRWDRQEPLDQQRVSDGAAPCSGNSARMAVRQHTATAPLSARGAWPSSPPSVTSLTPRSRAPRSASRFPDPAARHLPGSPVVLPSRPIPRPP